MENEEDALFHNELENPGCPSDGESVSSDTSGSAPGSVQGDEDGPVITVCKWDDGTSCFEDQETLDKLVRHLHDCS